MAKEHQLSTKGVRAGQVRTEFNEHAEALFLTSSFVFDSAAQAAARFANTEEGMVYSRYTNPTGSMFQHRLAAMEGAFIVSKAQRSSAPRAASPPLPGWRQSSPPRWST